MGTEPRNRARRGYRTLCWKSIREHLTAYGFMAPALLILGAFGLFPVGYAFYVSLHHWRLRKGALLGFDNYVRTLGEPRFIGCVALGVASLFVGWVLWRTVRISTRPARVLAALALVVGLGLLAIGVPGMVATGYRTFFDGLKVTVFYAIGTVPVQLCISMTLAYTLFRGVAQKGVFRLIFFLPYVTPMIASAVVFRNIFSPRSASIANRLVGLFGLRPQEWLFEDTSIVQVIFETLGLSAPDWLSDLFPSMALVSVILYNIWVYVGYQTVIFLAGLSAIPRELYEAAEIDGAGRWSAFRHVTVPLLSPTIFFLSMVALIGTFKAFNHIYIMRTPGAQGTVDTASIVIFDMFFKDSQAGYASAMALLLFAVILSLTLVQNRVMGRRVFYG